MWKRHFEEGVIECGTRPPQNVVVEILMANTDFDPKNIPPASFSFLVTTLGAQGAVALGMAPNPMTNKTEVQPELGKHAIDTLGILQEKTKGNLTGDETQLLEAVLHQLRMAYLQVKK